MAVPRFAGDRHDASTQPPRRPSAEADQRTIREADLIILAILASWRFYHGILAVVSPIFALARIIGHAS
jgi:hypothetical protein